MGKVPDELKLLDEWKTRLGLQDWYIVLQNASQDKDLIGEADGDVEYIESTKSAIIRVIDPEIRKDGIRPFDFESILVHELLHCKTALLCNGEDWEKDLQLRALHQVVDDIARALVDAKRCKSQKNDNLRLADIPISGSLSIVDYKAKIRLCEDITPPAGGDVPPDLAACRVTDIHAVGDKIVVEVKP